MKITVNICLQGCDNTTFYVRVVKLEGVFILIIEFFEHTPAIGSDPDQSLLTVCARY